MYGQRVVLYSPPLKMAGAWKKQQHHKNMASASFAKSLADLSTPPPPPPRPPPPPHPPSVPLV